MYRLSSILQDRELYSVEKHQTVFEVAQKMASLGVGAILVLRQGELCGIVSERDLMTRVIAAGRDPRTTSVADVMTTNLATIEESASHDDAMQMMQDRKCRHLPVLDNGRVIGMVSMRDLMHVELEQKTEELDHMRSYIHGAT